MKKYRVVKALSLFVLSVVSLSASAVVAQLDLRDQVSVHGTPQAIGAYVTGSNATVRIVRRPYGAAKTDRLEVGDQIDLKIFDDVHLLLTLVRQVPSSLGRRSFLATTEEDSGIRNAVIVEGPEGLQIDVNDYKHGRTYVVASGPDGVIVKEVDATKLRVTPSAPLRPPVVQDQGNARPPIMKSISEGTSRSCIDLLIAYDRGASVWANAHGGGVTNFASVAVQKMNLALANTGLDGHFWFRLVGLVVASGESTDLNAALQAATYGSEGWENIKAKRDELGADMVSVLIDTGYECGGLVGLGWGLRDTGVSSFADFAYNTCAIRSVAVSHTMTHECGHNLGAGHSDIQSSDPGPQLYDYSSGYYLSVDETWYHTIMSYDSDGVTDRYYTELPYFSSPEYSYCGVKVGDALHDNTRTLRQTCAAASQWRTQVIPAAYEITFNPPDGTSFDDSLNVEIHCEDDQADIRYTLDGSTPTVDSPAYEGPLTLTRSTTIKASVIENGTPGIVYEATYRITADALGAAIGAPEYRWTTSQDYPWTVSTECSVDGQSVLSPSNLPVGVKSWIGTTVEGPCSISFQECMGHAGMDYNGSMAVTCDGVVLYADTFNGYYMGFSGEIAVNIPKGSHSFRFENFLNAGSGRMYLDGIKVYPVSTPEFESSSYVSFEGKTEIRLFCSEQEAAIFYTLDGTEPTTASFLYEGPIPISDSTTIKAVAYVDGKGLSAVVSATYKRLDVESKKRSSGEWTMDVDGALLGAQVDGRLICTMYGQSSWCGWSQLINQVVRGEAFLEWARANGVYLISYDSTVDMNVDMAQQYFSDLADQEEGLESLGSPTTVFATAADPYDCIGYLSGGMGNFSNGSYYDGYTEASFESCVASLEGCSIISNAPLASVTEATSFPVSVELTNPVGEGTIYYTVDGTPPNPKCGQVYTQPIAIAEAGTTLRAAIWKEVDGYSSPLLICHYGTTDIEHDLTVPIDLVADGGRDKCGICLTWQGVEGARWYEVFRSTNQELSDEEQIKMTEKDYFWDESAQAGKTYWYRVRSVSDTEKSGYSSVAFACRQVETCIVRFDLGEHGVRKRGGRIVQIVKKGGQAVPPVVTPLGGFALKGWSADFNVVASNLTVQAIYAKGHEVVFDIGEHGTRMIGPKLKQFVADGNAAREPDIAADPGWSLVGWSADFSAVTSNVNLKAAYEPKAIEPLPADAKADWYVCATYGSDLNSGRSPSDPFATIQRAVDSAGGNETILVNDGVYDSVSAYTEIRIVSLHGCRATVIDGRGERSCFAGGYQSPTIKGFVLRKGRADYGGGASYGVLEDCVITDCEAREGGGCYESLLYGCVVLGNRAKGEQSVFGGGTSQGTAYDTLIAENQSDSYSGGCEYTGLRNSTVVDNVGAECVAGARNSGNVYSGFINSILSGNAFLSGAVSDIFADYKEETYINCIAGEVPPSGVGCRTDDPLFVDPENGDYRLREDSPAIDHAINVVCGKGTDVSGAPRLQGRGIDIGAYESIGETIERSVCSWYVDAECGSDAADGLTRDTAMKSIQNAVAAAMPGDTIHVYPGIYGSIATCGMPLNIVGVEGAEKTIITGSGRARCAYLGPGSTSSVMRGFTLKNGYAWNDVGGGAFGGCVEDCVFQNNYAMYGGAASHGSLSRCVLSKNKSVYDGAAADCCSLENCLVVRNRGWSVLSRILDYYRYDSYACVSCTIANNVSTNDWGESSATVNGSVQLTNCCLWNNECQGALSADDNKDDPRFVNPEADDYRLSAGSPCRDVGDNAQVATHLDLTGNARIINGRVDLGCYEYVPEDYVRRDVTVVFDATGGVSSETNRAIAIDNVIGRLPTAMRDGSTFVGWFTLPTDGDAVSNTTLATSNMTIYAHWSLTQYEISYVLNGGSNPAQNPTTYTVDDGLTLAAPTRAGYDFVGWSPNDGVISKGSTGAKTFTAHWSPRNNTILYIDTKGCANSNPATYTVEDAIAFSALTNPPGWKFVGWEPAEIERGTTGDKTVTAQWEQIKYRVDIGGEVDNTCTNGQVVVAETFAAITNGYTNIVCVGWVGTGDVPVSGTGNKVSFTVTQESSLTWLYATNYWVSVGAVWGDGALGDRALPTCDGGCVVVEDATGVTITNELWATAGTNLTAEATANEGWLLAGWHHAGGTRSVASELPEGGHAGRVTLPVTQSWILEAVFTSKVFTVTFDLGEHGTRSGGGELSQLVEWGKAAIEPTMTVRYGWRFTGWDVAFTNVMKTIIVTALYEEFVPPGASFIESNMVVSEGDFVEVNVAGGDAEKAASAQVRLTYQTASAADVDLKTATVDGVTPKGGVKFPLTLSWAAGEVTNRVIRIPVKTDKTVENDETLVFQLAGAEGQELGEMTVCRVTIHDVGYDALKEKIESGTATKSEQNAWKKLNANDGVPYVAGLASPADRGKVTGGGYCATGKKVTLKATATKGYAFAGWYTNDVLVARAPSLVIDRTAKPAKNSVTQSVLTGLEESQTFSAAFVTSAEDKANIAANVNGVSLTPWESKTETNAYATNIWAGVYLEWPVVARALSETTVKVSGLPSGLKFAANRIYGAPSAASKSKKVKVEGEGEQWIVTPSQVKVTVTTSGKSSQTYQIDTTVDSLPNWAVGTFTGPSYDTVTTNGLTTVTIGANGKISAKQPLNGKSTSFAAKYFDSYRADESAFHATLTAKVGKEVVTNAMSVGGALIETALPTGEELVVTNGCVEADLFDARQYNWKVEPWKTLVKTLNKQTLTYVILSDGIVVDAEDDPNAVGKVTLKFAANGSVTVAGEFVAESGAGGGRQATVKAKGSTVVVPADDGEALVFVYLAPKGLTAHSRCVRISFPTGL